MAYATVSESTLASPAELETIATLREKLAPELTALKDAGKDFPHTTGDIFMTRLLRGNNGDIDESVKWYKGFLELRAKFGLDDIHLECEKNCTPWVASAMPHHEEMKKYMNSSFDEKNLRLASGNLAWYDAMGDARTKEMLAEMPHDKIMKSFHTTFERRTSTLDKLSREEGRIVKITRIMDTEGTGFYQMNREWSRFEKEYVNPVLMGTSIETVHLVFLTNFPSWLIKVWDTIKVVIPPRLLTRFRILGSEYLQDQEYVTEVGPTFNQQLVATNKSHKAESATGDSSNYEGTDQSVPAGMVMERIFEVSPGQKVTWNFLMGKGEEASGSSGGYFSRFVTRMSGSEVSFSVNGIWTDKKPEEIQKVPAKVRSAGAEYGDTAEFWVDGKQIEYTAEAGVNIVAVDLNTRAVVSSKSYDPSKSGSNEELVSDLTALPRSTMILFAVKGTGAEELSKDAWDALEDCGAVLKQGYWHKGYAFIGTKWGDCVSESRGTDVVAEGDVPTAETTAVLVPPRDISVESGEQSGSVQVERGGLVILRWDNRHAYVANKALARFKLEIE